VTSSPMLKAAGNSELLTFTDSDFASCEETRESRSGAWIFFCNSLIYWKSEKQNDVSRSTIEAEFYALLEGITEVEFLQMLSILPTKLTKESSIATILQFSVIIQVQERFPAQSNPSHWQSTLKLLISGFNKNLPKKESKFTMWTLKIKLLISLPKVFRGHCLKNLRKDFDWYHQRKCDLSFPSPAWLGVPYYGLDNCETVFQDFGARFWDNILSANRCFRYFAFEIATSEFWKPNLFNFQSGFRFWSWEGC